MGYINMHFCACVPLAVTFAVIDVHVPKRVFMNLIYHICCHMYEQFTPLPGVPIQLQRTLLDPEKQILRPDEQFLELLAGVVKSLHPLPHQH